MGSGYITKYFGTTGGRDEIGLLPGWTARYLLSMDNRAKEIMLNHAELVAGVPIHYRESNPAKAFHGRPIALSDRPTFWMDESRITDGAVTVADRIPAAIGAVTSMWTPDLSHQASFSYVPYLITGERFFLDELFYWSSYNAASKNPAYRAGSQGLLHSNEVRGQAWSLRNLAHAAVMAPDGSPEKAYFQSQLENNLNYYATVSTRYPLRYWGIDNYATKDNMTADVKYVTNVWMHDFMMVVLAHLKALGIDTTPLLNEHSKFTIGRFAAPGFNPFNGAPYRFPAQYTDNSYPLTWAQANASFAVQGSSYSTDPQGYASIAMAALSGLLEFPDAPAALDFLRNNTTIDHRQSPQWAIIP